MTVAAIVQARLGSSRLPGKVLRQLAGRPMVDRVVARAARIPGVDRVVAAVPEGARDEPLAEHLASLPGVVLHRGPEDDVLARYAGAARQVAADVVVRITADCPLLCPSVSGRVVAAFLEGSCDYASNTRERTYPRGLDTEAFSREALETAHREATDPAEREHVTPFLWRRPERFRLIQVTGEPDRSHLRWTVDTEEDFLLVSKIYGELLPAREDFDYEDVLACLERHPEWFEINRHVVQKTVS